MVNDAKRYSLTSFIRTLIEVTEDKILEGEIEGANLTLEDLEYVMDEAMEEFTLFLCLDCEIDTKSEYYMVHDSIWKEATQENERKSVLCIGCLENRIGRSLNSEDFPDVPLNTTVKNMSHSEVVRTPSYQVSDRLKNRLLY